MITSAKQKMDPFRDIFEEHVNEVIFLWELRSSAVKKADYTQLMLAKLETRINRHVYGLMNSIEHTWICCKEAITSVDGAGEAFVLTLVAFLTKDMAKIKYATNLGVSNKETCKGFVSALAWLPADESTYWTHKFLLSPDVDHKYAALVLCSIRRFDPGIYLHTILNRKNINEHQQIYIRAIRLVGELKRIDLLPIIKEISCQVPSKNNTDEIFWACWSCVLLGEYTMIDTLKQAILTNDVNQYWAMNTLFRILPVTESRQLISELSTNKTHTKQIITAISILGDPVAVDWLIAHMEEPVLAPLAGEAFSWITGINLLQKQLVQSEGMDAGPVDDELDFDGLPKPDVKKVMATWLNIKSQFMEGQRYVLGLPVHADHLHTILENGNQQHRKAAALELALLHADNPYIHYKTTVTGKIQ